MGLKRFHLWDFDKVEEHNLPNQFFTETDLGQDKAWETGKHILEFNSTANVEYNIKKFKPKDSFSSQIVISCVDTMKARKTIFESCLKCKSVQLFIDTRMAGLQGQVYTVDMNNKEQITNYKKTLFNDDDAVQERCTARSILFTVLGIASIVCSQTIKALNGEQLKNYTILDYNTNQIY